MTTNRLSTIERVLNKADPDVVADVFRKMKLGQMLTPRKITFSGLASSATQDITTAAALAAATCVPALPAEVTKLPPILSVISLRVTAGTLAAGPALVTDSGGTATAIGALSNHVVLLSDDGKSLVFQAAVTGFVLEYIPRAASGDDNTPTDMTSAF